MKANLAAACEQIFSIPHLRKPFQTTKTFSKRKHFFLIALLALGFASCKKATVENNSNKGVDPTPPPSTCKVLRKMTETTNGVSTVHNFVYNNARQLTALKTAAHSEEIDFTYDGDGNVVKMENLEPNAHNIYEYN